MKKVGVLAVQGAFIEHCRRLSELGVTPVELRKGDDVQTEFDGLVLPGGESTVQSKLLHELGMFESLHEKIKGNMPVLGTCAGLILLAQKIANGGDESQSSAMHTATLTTSQTPVIGFSTMPVTVLRNAYGRQLGSFHTEGKLFLSRESGEQVNVTIPMTFIRAPFIAAYGSGVDIITTLEDGTPVGVRYRNQFGVTFHPELDNDLQLYSEFIAAL
ncbi:pyridoxal 5'-phosphate synthase glutaminase subunit PdxT [Arcanobacterium ihumii]|uniref:pyridoxal 5'-phosphate synthase glutaminase subunit PdxT n=1 Tax=Arcanobacterium ihumii TaxID=2138162 RepID=UPI000F51BEB5|nr:pyridoxal 5'-phosphate synthase glutaminase subunit PdxT [Arcanobacterium ihumii]